MINESIILKDEFNDKTEAILSYLNEFIDFANKLNVEIVKSNKYISKLMDLRVQLKSLEEENSQIPDLNILSVDLDQLMNEYNEASANFVTLKLNDHLSRISPEAIIDYNHYIPNNIPWQNDQQELFIQRSQSFIDQIKAIALTSLTIKSSLPLKDGLFDLLVIDEASQCDMASAIPLIARSKKVVIIGDPLQLKHITSVKKHELKYLKESLGIQDTPIDYVEKSLFDHAQEIANRSNLESIFLKEHYRCHEKIVGFSNHYFYLNKLGQELKVKTNIERLNSNPKGCYWINSNGNVEENININNLDVHKVIEVLTNLRNHNPNSSIGVITPFRHQKEQLQRNNPFPNITIDTVHKFQGDEKDIIIFNPVVSNGARPSLSKFINEYSPELLNVAITRARSLFIVIGNFDYCKNQGDTLLAKLANYVELHGTIE